LVCPSPIAGSTTEGVQTDMAKRSKIVKCSRPPKYRVRGHSRCLHCGRPRGYMRKFGVCRICFRKLAGEGKIPGVIKSSW